MKRRSVRPNAKKILRLRDEKGWSQEVFAHRAGLSTGAVARLEKGERVYRHTLKAAAEALDVEVSNILITETASSAVSLPPESTSADDYTLRESLRQALRLAASKGAAAPEVEAAFTRAYFLYEESGKLPEFYTSLQGMCFTSLAKGDLRFARMLGSKLRRQAEEKMEAPVFQMEARITLGAVLSFAGEFAEAQALLAEAYAFYTPAMHRSPDTLADSKVTCLSYMTHVWYALGYPEQAQGYIREALQWARELSHGYSLALLRHYGAALFQLLQELEETEHWARAETQQSTELNLALWQAGGMIQEGWAWVMQGRLESGLQRMHDGMQAWRLTEARTGLARWHTLLAEAYGRVGQPAKGLAELKLALDVVADTGDRHYEAETHRLRGELLLQQHPPHAAQAEACFLRALDVARGQQAKSFELRAAIRLSRLWRQQGKQAEARDLLVPVYTWFQEGFDTADLREARRLLDDLSKPFK